VIRHVFVYGTLRRGDVRWHFLQPFVAGGTTDTVDGIIFDTGFDYPGAVFGEPGTIHGETFELRDDTVDQALAVLDEVEGVVDGDYARVEVTTGRGYRAWAYAYGGGDGITPIESGDWLAHRPLPSA
jgi:gamma-glutamylcyclotransferase (GGCT)/AIG2-like uncharacterized protein YtfP